MRSTSNGYPGTTYVSSSARGEAQEFETLAVGDTCQAGEGPPAAVPDPERRGPHPLIYRGITRLRSRNASVGYAQQLINIFLSRRRAGTHACSARTSGGITFINRGLAELRSRGQDPIDVDCRFGPNTELATQVFQMCEGLTPDGKIGPLTWRRLIRLAPGPGPVPPPVPVTPPPSSPPVPTPAACPPATCTPPASFLPSVHGFRFSNPGTMRVPVPGVGLLAVGMPGLCGGMAYAALDYFNSCVPLPTTAISPALPGDPLFRHLATRQVESVIAGRSFEKYLGWTLRPDTSIAVIDGVQELTAREFTGLRAVLSAGNTAVLGLIKATSNPTEHHQVLAYAISPVSATVFNVHIYDSNFPGRDDVVIEVTLASATRVTSRHLVGGSPLRAVRGFFMTPYAPRVPPCVP
ncbi:MAG: peptidoglycan-binding protein [Pyrinomonadaceae bacterium]|nr:peptidoglycan-binding protein [Phycisphaerales bacterium]